MTRILAISGREFGSFFSSPLGFVVIAIFMLLTGYFFDVQVREYAIWSLEAARNPAIASQLNLHDGFVRPFYQTIAFFLMLVTPLISMRLLAEEKRQGTAEFLLTAPLRTSELVLGKYLGALGFLTVLLLLSMRSRFTRSCRRACPASRTSSRARRAGARPSPGCSWDPSGRRARTGPGRSRSRPRRASSRLRR